MEQHIYLFSPIMPSNEAKLSTDQAVKGMAEGYINVFPEN